MRRPRHSGRAALAFALVVGLAGACFDSGLRWDSAQAGLTAPCTVGQIVCVGDELEECVGDGGSSSYSKTEDCSATGRVCSESLGACSMCAPNTLSCDGMNAEQCKPDGSGTTFVAACDPTVGQACRDGQCIELCDQAEQQKSNIGCEYWAVDLDNARISAVQNAAAQQFAVVVSNAQPDVATTVHVYQDDGAPGDPPSPIEIATSVIAPLNLEVFTLGPREVDGSPDGEFNTGTHTALTRHAYRVVTDFPVVAYQFNPLDNVDVFSNDASLLKPREALSFDDGSGGPPTMVPAYVALGWPQTIAITDDPNTNFDPDAPINLRAFLTIVGTTAGTTVRVHPTTSVREGGPVGATAPGGVLEVKLDAFDVLNLETPDFDSFNADFTGTLIEADQPIAVFTGSEASDAPHYETLSDRQCCADHLEDQLDPLRTLGKSFAIAHTPSRTTAVALAGGGIGVAPEPDFVRFVAGFPGTTTIKTSLPAPDDVITLTKRGDFHEVTVFTDFVATSSQPVSVGQVMASQEAAAVPTELPGGDPSLTVYPPVEQFRPDYVFLTPDKYSFDFLSIIAPPTATVELDGRTLDGTVCLVTPTDGLTEDQRGSITPPFVTYTCQLSFPVIDPQQAAPNNISPGVQNDGVHALVANAPVGLIVMGWDNFVSYAYAGGTQLADITGPIH
jgi:hypothetical protein